MNKFIAILCALVAGFGSLSAETHYKGDINDDGKVDLADMVALATAINESKSDKNRHDINASGSVDDGDLQTLADIILSEKLIEDTGFNIGIGGWDDGGEDFGGEVFSTRPSGYVKLSRASEPSFFISNPLYDLDQSRQYVNIGISSPEHVCGALFEIRLNHDALSFDITKDLILNSAVGTLDGHIFYGKPLINKDNESTIDRIRFILFSPALKPFQATNGAMVRLYFDGHGGSDGQFQNCQTISANATVATYHPTSDFYNDWLNIPITKIEITNQQPLEIALGQSAQLNISILPTHASNQNVSYTSENSEIASVDQLSGYVTANSVGETTITVIANDGSGIYASCNVTVTKTSGIDEIIADTEEMNIYNSYGQLLKEKASTEYFNQLPSGFYIIATPSKSFKYLK